MNGCESLLINKYASDSLGHICCLDVWILSLALFSVTKLVFREKCESKCVYCVNAGWKSRSFFFEACLAIFRDFSSGFTLLFQKKKTLLSLLKLPCQIFLVIIFFNFTSSVGFFLDMWLLLTVYEYLLDVFIPLVPCMI